MKKFVVVVNVLQTTQNVAISSRCFAEDDKEIYQLKMDDARVKLLYYSSSFCLATFSLQSPSWFRKIPLSPGP